METEAKEAEAAQVQQANDRQVGGDHYKKFQQFQPWDAWWHWKLNPFQAAILKHVVRYKDKMGLQDLHKARHYLDKLIELENREPYPKKASPDITDVVAGQAVYHKPWRTE